MDYWLRSEALTFFNVRSFYEAPRAGMGVSRGSRSQERLRKRIIPLAPYQAVIAHVVFGKLCKVFGVLSPYIFKYRLIIIKYAAAPCVLISRMLGMKGDLIIVVCSIKIRPGFARIVSEMHAEGEELPSDPICGIRLWYIEVADQYDVMIKRFFGSTRYPCMRPIGEIVYFRDSS
jgi:hypothetical protein